MKIAIYLFLAFSIILFSCSGKKKNDVITFQVIKGDYVEKINIHGTVQAVVNYPVLPPRSMFGQMTVLLLAADGAYVKKGDTICVLTVPELESMYQETKTSVEKLEAELKKTEADSQLNIALLEARELFNFEDPLTKNIKLGDQWFEVVGVLQTKALFTETVGELAARDLNNDVYIPLSTFWKRIPKTNILSSELKQVTVKLESSGILIGSASIIRNILTRRHFNNDDFSIIIPYELMEQEKDESRIYNLLLASIAAISLIVGGIGIMNIMLASILERTQEIGIRRAVGGRRSDIMGQFVIEAIAMSITGGLIGVLFGISLSLGITVFTEIKTSLTLYSIFLAFSFSVLVGITFGYLPAKRAADLKPIESIRHE